LPGKWTCTRRKPSSTDFSRLTRHVPLGDFSRPEWLPRKIGKRCSGCPGTRMHAPTQWRPKGRRVQTGSTYPATFVNLPGRSDLVIFQARTAAAKNQGSAFWAPRDPNACPAAVVARSKKVCILVDLPGEVSQLTRQAAFGDFSRPNHLLSKSGNAFWVPKDPNACPSAAVARLEKVRLRRTMSLIFLVNLPGKAHLRIVHAPTTCFKDRGSAFWVRKNPNACPSAAVTRSKKVRVRRTISLILLVNLSGKLHLVIVYAQTAALKNRGSAFWVPRDPNACPTVVVARSQ